MMGCPTAKRISNETLNDDSAQALRAQSDPAVFAELYDRYAHPVYRYVFNRIGSQQAAEDVTAQVFLQAFEHIKSYRAVGSFAAWLFTIARRRTADYYRRYRSTQILEEETAQDSTDVLSEMIHADDIHRLVGKLQKLTKQERELLRLRYAACLSFADIGALLGKKPAAVKTATYRLLARLAQNLEDSHARKP